MALRFRKPSLRLRGTWDSIAILSGAALLIAACVFYLFFPRILEPIRHWTFDTYQRISPRIPDPEKMPARVAIIDIDEASLAAYGQWPWPRTLLAELVEKLRGYGVLVIGFDIVFAEADRTSPAQLRDTLKDIPEHIRDTLANLPDHDTVFAQSIAKGKVVLGQVGEHKPVAKGRLSPKEQFATLQSSPNAPALHQLLRRYPGAVLNLPALEQPAAGIGLFSTLPDADGTYRKVAMLERIGDTDEDAVIFPALSLEMIRVALGGADSVFVKTDAHGIDSIAIKATGGGTFRIPTDSYGRIWVHFARYATGEPPLYISAKAVLEQSAPKPLLANTLALIGTSAVGLKDIRATPINGQMPGVEVHAQVMETILSDTHLKRQPRGFWGVGVEGVELLAIIIGGGLMIALVPFVSAVLGFIAGAGIIGGLVWMGWHSYLEERVLLDYAYPSLCVFGIFFMLTYLNYMREEAQKKQIRSAFGHYVSPALLEQLAKHPEKLVLGGETRPITVLFTDIRGFTTISERFNAQELTRFINRFLTPMTNVIMAHEGTVDKYMGDAIMAFWNAPLDVPDHAIRACRAALAMQEAVKALNGQLRQEGNQQSTQENRRHAVQVHIGIGINSGNCCVGNMGSEQRFDYSALGDDVNLASRLEGQSKTYGVDVVLGENTYRALDGAMACIELDLIQVKGKTKPVRIYALLGEDTTACYDVAACMDALLTAYRSQNWDEAQQHAEHLTTLHQGLGVLSQLYMERIGAYRQHPPAEDWDGVFIATSK